MQTKAGVNKYKETMIKKFGSYENWLKHLKTMGSKGGKATVPKGFARNIELARKVGAIGGKKSRRTK